VQDDVEFLSAEDDDTELLSDGTAETSTLHNVYHRTSNDEGNVPLNGFHAHERRGLLSDG
jgi:hypothetical protein